MEMELPHLQSRGGADAILYLEPNSSVSVTYHPLFGSHEDLMLLELDEKLLPDILHQRVTIRGDAAEAAVLCTQSKTYAIKFVGTSNSVFLVPPLDQSDLHENPQQLDNIDVNRHTCAPVLKVSSGSMELVEVAPRLEKLKRLLLENPYKTDEAAEMDESESIEENNKSLYTWDDLIEKVQASDEELRTGLASLSAVEIYGYYRIVDENYMNMILNMLLHNCVFHDWSFDALNEDKVVTALVSDGFPFRLAQHCLHVFGSRVHDVLGNNSMWSLDEKRVCVHFARQILGCKKMKLKTFMEEWTRKVPEGMQANFTMLEGEVLTESMGAEAWVYSFSVSSLPCTPAERFSLLFRERPKWEEKELQHYIRDLSVPGLSSEGLLLKYTRRTQATMDVEPVFSAR